LITEVAGTVCMTPSTTSVPARTKSPTRPAPRMANETGTRMRMRTSRRATMASASMSGPFHGQAGLVVRDHAGQRGGELAVEVDEHDDAAERRGDGDDRLPPPGGPGQLGHPGRGHLVGDEGEVRGPGARIDEQRQPHEDDEVGED